MSDTFDHELDAFESYIEDGGSLDLLIDNNKQKELISENDKNIFDALKNMF